MKVVTVINSSYIACEWTDQICAASLMGAIHDSLNGHLVNMNCNKS